MGFRFRRSIKIAPGIRLNVNKKSTGLTIGPGGAKYTLNTRGRKRMMVGLPGTGLSYTAASSRRNSSTPKTIPFVPPSPASQLSSSAQDSEAPNRAVAPARRWYQQSWGIILLLVLFFPIGLVLMWTSSSWSLRTKRAVTGAFLYPAGAYFLWRYTRLGRRMKLAAAAAALVETGLLATAAASFGILILAVAFLVLFLRFDAAGPVVPAVDDESYEVLGIETARSAPERRLLIAREFSRLAQTALSASPTDRSTWLGAQDLNRLTHEAVLLQASASDPGAAFLPETDPGDALTAEQLRKSAQTLLDYVHLQARLASVPAVDAEETRVFMRERTHLQNVYDELVRELQTAPAPQ